MLRKIDHDLEFRLLSNVTSNVMLSCDEKETLDINIIFKLKMDIQELP